MLCSLSVNLLELPLYLKVGPCSDSAVDVVLLLSGSQC